MEKKRWGFVGVDETNNGRFPLIYAAVFSNHFPDIAESEKLMVKRRRNHQEIYEKLTGKHYSFTIIQRDDLDLIDSHQVKGIALASLVSGIELKIPFRLYMDGALSERESDFIMSSLEGVTGIDRESINLYSGKDLDRKIKLVNIADETAHWLKNKRDLANHEKFKPLLRSLRT